MREQQLRLPVAGLSRAARQLAAAPARQPMDRSADRRERQLLLWVRLCACGSPCWGGGRCAGCAAADRFGDVDEVVVERLIHGIPVRSTMAERREAVRALRARGLAASVIADRMCTSARQVERYLAADRCAA